MLVEAAGDGRVGCQQERGEQLVAELDRDLQAFRERPLSPRLVARPAGSQPLAEPTGR